MALADLEDLKRHLRTEGKVAAGPSPADDAYLTMLLEAASDFLADQLPERTLEPKGSPEAPVEWRARAARAIQVPDLRQAVAVELDERALTFGTGYRLHGRFGKPALWVLLPTYSSAFPGYDSSPLAPAGGDLLIRGVWGPEAVEPRVKLATLNLAARAYHNRTSRFADSVVDPAGGVASYFRQMPADVQAVVDALRVPGL